MRRIRWTNQNARVSDSLFTGKRGSALQVSSLQRKTSETVSAISSADEIAVDFPPFLRVYKDGRVERLRGTDIVPPSIDPKTGVSSKDVSILTESGVSARLFLPKLTDPTQKLPILIHYHGGGFLIETPFSPLLHNYLNALVAEANVIVVSVHYRRAPENPLPTAYNDSWAALQWTASHANGGPESWLKDHGDFTRLFVSGESAGGNIAHHIAMRAGSHELDHGVKIYGAILVHPFFWGTEAIGNKMKYPATQAMMERLWMFVCPSTTGLDDPLINPTAVGAPSLKGLGCERVFVCVAGMDALRD
ncbi:tuliposide A-converting enzyme 1, chloroplastic-like [Magnolia sinica]|uniref:tuliposide A-converting enzyme 1, chloroplastic-like n=1 Tax=Magnolia sinica TaxID=86752 RepID=UPI00265A54D8|nr:tuliposide A-converting enzyme 1, chloroplastic-like [Magnolia sinica]